MNTFTIKDIENLSGIKAHTIRIWEQRYSFLRPNRTDTNIRYYTNDELKIILNIALLNKYGYKVSHIDKMSEEDILQKAALLNQSDALYERVINELINHMVDLDMELLNQVLNNFVNSKGIEKAITNIIFPFMERIGFLWLTNHINPAQEHLVSNIIRQKMLVAIENCEPIVKRSTIVLLFLPEGEHHELSLLYLHYLLKKRGISVLYLGADIPLKDVVFLANYKKPQYLYTHLTCVAQNFSIEKFLSNIQSSLPEIKTVISGAAMQAYNKKLPSKNVEIKRSFSEIMEFVNSI